MTTNKEDYLKAIYHIGGLTERVSTKAIAQRLGIASASVTEMLARLAKESFISYQPYKGSQLTQKGFDACINVVLSHKLWEVFLVQYLGYSLSEAHNDAEALEHATSPLLAERLDALLNHPDFCPHGASIPRPGNIPTERSLTALSEQPAGSLVEICRIAEKKELLDYLERIDLNIGMKILIKSYGEYEGPLELSADGRQIQISKKAADQIMVSLVQAE